jgi:hypothetical protein
MRSGPTIPSRRRANGAPAVRSNLLLACLAGLLTGAVGCVPA